MEQDDTICVECGQRQSEHHAFVAGKKPASCVCEAREWGNPFDIPPVCRRFEPLDEDPGRCVRCEHDKACHKANAGVERSPKAIRSND